VSEGRAAIRRDGRWNLLATGGRWLLDDDAAGCSDFSGGLCAVRPDELVGFVDRDGAWVIDPRFEATGAVIDGRVAVKLPGGRWRMANTTGKLLGVEVDQLGQHRDGRSRARVGDRWGYVDASGEMVIEPRFDDAWDFACDVAAVRRGDRWTLIDRGGRELFEPGFDRLLSARGGFAVFEDGPTAGIASAAGAVIASGFEEAYAFADGRALVRQRGRWGYVDESGELVIAPRWGEARGFSEGLAAVSVGGAWGFIDTSGEMAIEARHGTPGPFHDGRARVHTASP
jgi:hypothetical protein